MNVIFSCDVSYSIGKLDWVTYSILDLGNLSLISFIPQEHGTGSLPQGSHSRSGTSYPISLTPTEEVS